MKFLKLFFLPFLFGVFAVGALAQSNVVQIKAVKLKAEAVYQFKSMDLSAYKLGDTGVLSPANGYKFWYDESSGLITFSPDRPISSYKLADDSKEIKPGIKIKCFGCGSCKVQPKGKGYVCKGCTQKGGCALNVEINRKKTGGIVDRIY